MNLKSTKTGLLGVFLLVLTSAAFSQPLSSYDQRIFLGIRGGLNITNIEGAFDIPEFVSSDFKYKSRYTGHFGIVGNYHVTRGLAFQAEVNYAMMGAQTENNRQLVDLHAINFLELPVLVRLMAGNHKKTQVFLEAGPAISIALFAQDHYRDGRILNAKENYHGASYGVLGGVGVQFFAKKYRVALSGRYSYAFTDLNEFVRVTNRMRGITVGLTLMKDIFYYY